MNPLKINEDVEIKINDSSLVFEGKLGRNRNGYWFELKELTGWGEDWKEENLSFEEMNDLLSSYTIIEYRR